MPPLSTGVPRVVARANLILFSIVLASCRGEPWVEGVPADELPADAAPLERGGCAAASDCEGQQYCSILEGDVRGLCVAVPEACGVPADCSLSACARALDLDCPEGTLGICSNPIDRRSRVVGNPVVTCSGA